MPRKLEINWMELDAEEKGYISQTRRSKSLTLTEKGLLRAQELEERHTF